MTMSTVSPRKELLNILSHPPITLITTSTIVVQRMTAISDTQAIRRLRRYLRMRWSLYIMWELLVLPSRAESGNSRVQFLNLVVHCYAEVLRSIWLFRRPKPDASEYLA